jgi:hypothetical protein
VTIDNQSFVIFKLMVTPCPRIYQRNEGNVIVKIG